MALHGYMGKVLFINLSNHSSEEKSIEDNLFREFIGGYGLGVRILYEKMQAGVDPLGPDNILGFIVGTFVGTKSHGAGRFNVVAKSPLTNGWADSSCGGNFGPKLRNTGFDGIFVTGKSEKPVFLLVTEQGVEFRDASHLWGKDSGETENIIKAEFGKTVGVVSIGQAGEKLSKISGVMHDQGRAAARQGLGAVMGSKNLKAVVVKGSQHVSIANEADFDVVIEQMRNSMKNKGRLATNIGKYGTASIYAKNVAIQDAPMQNWKGISSEVYSLEQAAGLAGDSYDKYVKKRYACAQCAIACGAILEVNDSKEGQYLTHRPEYETVASFGSLCLVDDIETVMRANELCNRYGLDTISAGATIAFAMECYEKGIISEQDTGGLALTWGAKEVIIQLLELMRKREGIGDILADGVKIAAEKLGKNSAEFALHVGGQELAMHDPRCWPGFGYGYVFDPTPGRHTTGGVGFVEHGWSDQALVQYELDNLGSEKYNYEAKGKPLSVLNNWFQFINSTGLCIFTNFGYNPYPVLETFRAITGWNDFDLAEALKAGERINNLRHCFNLREGLNPQELTLPKRVLGDPPLHGGPTAGVTIDIDSVRKSYYAEMDWNILTGKPSAKKLESLNLTQLVGDGVGF